MISSIALATLFASTAFAQSSVSEAMSAASVSVSAAVSAVAGPSLSVSSAISAIPSGIASASASGTVPALSNTTYGFDCPAGYLLTYGITNATLSGVDLPTAVAFFSNFSNSAPGEVTESTDTTRTYNTAIEGIEPFTVSEVLTNSTTDPATGALHQTFNTTAPITIAAFGVNIASIFSDLQVYSNDTNGVTTLQYFINVCTDNQEITLGGLPQILSAFTTSWGSQLTGAVQSGSMSMSMSAASSAPAGGILGSASSALNSATAAPSSILASVTGAPAGVLSSITAAPGGLLSSATAGLPIPSLRARGRWM